MIVYVGVWLVCVALLVYAARIRNPWLAFGALLCAGNAAYWWVR
jgi:hypothetical protein